MDVFDVFISYRRHDGGQIAQALREYLTAKGLRVFWDKCSIKDGHYFHTQIKQGLLKAPNYILIASQSVFPLKSEGEEDWVRTEIEVAVEEYEQHPEERTLTVLLPTQVEFPKKEELPENIRRIAYANQIPLTYGDNTSEAFGRVLKAVTSVNRRSLWHAAHKWYERSKLPGGRFADLAIDESILPMVLQKASDQRNMSGSVSTEKSTTICPLKQALSSDNHHIYLIGQGGAGKTTALMHIMDRTYRTGNYTLGTQVPLFVELSFAPDMYGELYKNGKSTFIRRAIYKQIRTDRTLRQIHFSQIDKIDDAFKISPDVAVAPIESALSQPMPTPEYLLLLDGLNEVSTKEIVIDDDGTRVRVYDMIAEEIRLLMTDFPNVRVVLTGRYDDNRFSHTRVTKQYLVGVDETSIQRYLMNSNMEALQIDAAMNHAPLLDTLKIPLFLTMYASLNDKEGISSQGDIFRVFFHEMRERRSETSVYTLQNRLLQVENDIQQFSAFRKKNRMTSAMQNFVLDFILPEIAWYMCQAETMYMDIDDIQQIVEAVLTDTSDTAVCGKYGKERFDKYRNGDLASSHTAKVAKELRESLGEDFEETTEQIVNMLVQTLGLFQMTDWRYGFFHQHIRDYFAAVKIVQTWKLAVHISNRGDRETACRCAAFLQNGISDVHIRRFVGEYLGEHRNRPFCENGVWRYGVPTKACDRTILSRALALYRGEFGETAARSVASIVSVLQEVRGDLSGMDLSRLDLTACRLNGTVLSRKGLPTVFDGSKLTGQVLFSQEHAAPITAIAFSPDGTLFATASCDGDIKLWDLQTGCVRFDVHVSEQELCSLCFSRDSHQLVVWCYKTVVMFTIEENICQKTGEYVWMNRETLFDEDNDFVIVRDTRGVYVYNGDMDTLRHTFDYPSTGCDGNTNLPYIRICENTIEIVREDRLMSWNSKTDVRTEMMFTEAFNSACSIRTDAKQRYSAIMEDVIFSDNRRIVITETQTEKRVKTLEDADGFVDMRFSWNGDRFAVLTKCGIARVYQTADGQCIREFQKSEIQSIKCSADGKRVLIASESAVAVRNLSDGSLEGVLYGHGDIVTSLDCGAGGSDIVTASADGTIKVWDAVTLENKQTFRKQQGMVCSVMVSPNGTRIAAAIDQVPGCVKVFDAVTGEETAAFEQTVWKQTRYFVKSPLSVIYSPDGERLSVVWNHPFVNNIHAETMTECDIFSLYYDREEFYRIISVAYPPIGSKVLLLSHNMLKIWDQKNQRVLPETIWTEGAVCVEYAPDGNTFLTAAKDGETIVWDARTYARVGTLSPKKNDPKTLKNNAKWLFKWLYSSHDLVHNRNTVQMRFSSKSATYTPDSRCIVTVSQDSGISVWDIQKNTEEIQRFEMAFGLYIGEADFRRLHPDSVFTEQESRILRQYGVMMDTE